MRDLASDRRCPICSNFVSFYDFNGKKLTLDNDIGLCWIRHFVEGGCSNSIFIRALSGEEEYARHE